VLSASGDIHHIPDENNDGTAFIPLGTSVRRVGQGCGAAAVSGQKLRDASYRLAAGIHIRWIIHAILLVPTEKFTNALV
jgi:hypothetical protein